MAISIVAAPSADAAVSCAFGGSSGPEAGIVTLDLGASGDSATISVAGGALIANGAGCTSPSLIGESATTRNTEVVRVRDSSGDGSVELRIVDPAGFAPGLVNESDGSAEIEFDINFGPGAADILRLEAGGADTEDRFELGLLGSIPAANLNARAEGSASEDVDLGVVGAERIVADGRTLDDKLDGAGGAPFTAALDVGVELFGQDGEDLLGGGSRADILHGGNSDDLLSGGDGRDVLLGDDQEDILAGGEGADRLDGGPDDDLVDYRVLGRGAKRGVDLDLRGGTVGGAGAGDRIVSIEGAFASPLDDTVVGNGALNFVDGGGGDDDLGGGAERDALLGSAGDDLLDGGGARDILFGGPGDDAIHGELGKDIVFGNAGQDRITTEEGVDVVDVSGGGRDVVDCGPGEDGYDADRRDKIRSCEVALDIDD
ncbi:MAG: calcium-binding protein [Solirubrobacterales bacterium]